MSTGTGLNRTFEFLLPLNGLSTVSEGTITFLGLLPDPQLISFELLITSGGFLAELSTLSLNFYNKFLTPFSRSIFVISSSLFCFILTSSWTWSLFFLFWLLAFLETNELFRDSQTSPRDLFKALYPSLFIDWDESPEWSLWTSRRKTSSMTTWGSLPIADRNLSVVFFIFFFPVYLHHKKCTKNVEALLLSVFFCCSLLGISIACDHLLQAQG